MTDAQLQQKRLVAALIDIAILIALGAIMGLVNLALRCGGTRVTGIAFLAPLLWVVYSIGALLYVVGRDVLSGDRSLGKRMMGIRVVTVSGLPVTAVDSVKRNALFAPLFALGVILSFLQVIPILGCVSSCVLLPLEIIAALLSLGVVIWEMVQIFQHPEGVRMGDQLAGTRVVL
jgi:uncharacterized RDD family membrane protein YckC